MSKSKVLVTGSAGFIFSNFMRFAQRQGSEYEFISLDRISSYKNIKNVYEHRRQKFHLADVSDRHIINKIFEIEKPDIVIHGAACSHVDDSISNSLPFIKSNVFGTQVIVDACVKYDVDRLVYISSDEVYGQLDNDHEPWKENDCLAPRNPYSASKAAGELVVKAAHNTHGLKYNITRSCNNFGPRQSAKNFIPKIIKCILNNENIPVYGQGAQIREWIHVHDNCSAILSIMKGPANETYNISAGYETSNIELVNIICNSMNDGHNLITFVEDRKGHDFRYATNSEKLKSIGWSPQIKFMEGINMVTSWYNKNRWFLKDFTHKNA